VVPTNRRRSLAIARGGDFHGVISDMRTPGGVDGAQVYAGSPLIARTRLPVVFITGDIANEETAARCARTGAPVWKSRFVFMTSFPWSRKPWAKAGGLNDSGLRIDC